MSRKYTAQEMREMASTIEDKRVICSVENSGDTDDRGLEIYYHESHYGECLTVAAMLRHAADAMEREEREKKKYQYQYAARYFYPSGSIATDYPFDNPTDAKLFSFPREGAKKIICRRKIGEWEDVKE